MVELTISMLRELGEICRVRTSRDELTILAREREEGVSFLTITMPSLEKEILSLLDKGYSDTNFKSFRTGIGGLPKFLSGFLQIIFPLGSSYPASTSPESAAALRAVRQILSLHSKVELECTPDRIAAAVHGYVETDDRIRDVDPVLLREFRITATELFGSYLRDVERVVLSENFAPRHSSGALATRESYNSRYSLGFWTERLQSVLPWWHILSVNWRDSYENPPVVLSEEDERPAKLTLVPKTMKTPRVIAMEPAEHQYVQQGLHSAMREVLDMPKHRALYESMCWADQSFNRDLARQASIDQGYATIDLSEASDRVSLQLAQAVLGSNLLVGKVALASRSRSIILPDGTKHYLKKFASMGSALCFPIETMVFRTIIEMGMRRSPTYKRTGVKPPVRVYGDDLIIPIDSTQSVCDLLEAMGLKVNLSKSFWASAFRESCGSDWYSGHDVSIVRNRAASPTRSDHFTLIAKEVDLHNRLYERGYYQTAGLVEKRLRRLRHIPYAPVGTPGVCFWSWESSYYKTRVNRDLQRLEVQVLSVMQRKPLDQLSDFGALRKCLTHKGENPRELAHLERDGRSQPVGMKVGWATLV